MPSKLDLREVDLIYNDYIRVMTIMYEKLKFHYNTFVERFLTEDERKENGIQIEHSKFCLPTEYDQQDTIEKKIKNQSGKAKLTRTKEESKQTPIGTDGNEMATTQNKVFMKSGDEDLVDDEASDIFDNRENVVINEAPTDQRLTGSIPMLLNNKNALVKSTKPLS